MNNRTIRNAIMKRVPEIYFIFAPIPCIDPVTKKPAWMVRMYANVKIKGKGETLFKIAATMPQTAIISHKELLTTLISEITDEVKAIKNRTKSPEMMPQEKDWTPISDADQRALGINSLEDMLADNPHQIFESNIDVKEPIKLPMVEKAIDKKGRAILDEFGNALPVKSDPKAQKA